MNHHIKKRNELIQLIFSFSYIIHSSEFIIKSLCQQSGLIQQGREVEVVEKYNERVMLDDILFSTTKKTR